MSWETLLFEQIHETFSAFVTGLALAQGKEKVRGNSRLKNAERSYPCREFELSPKVFSLTLSGPCDC